jgi:hypothetical protein
LGERRRYKICNIKVGIRNSSTVIPISLAQCLSVKNL